MDEEDNKSMELYIVPCNSNFPRYEEDEDGNQIEKEPNFPNPPRRWGPPSVKYRVDIPVVASSKEEATKLAEESDYAEKSLDIGPFVAEYVGEME